MTNVLSRRENTGRNTQGEDERLTTEAGPAVPELQPGTGSSHHTQEGASPRGLGEAAGGRGRHSPLPTTFVDFQSPDLCKNHRLLLRHPGCGPLITAALGSQKAHSRSQTPSLEDPSGPLEKGLCSFI